MQLHKKSYMIHYWIIKKWGKNCGSTQSPDRPTCFDPHQQLEMGLPKPHVDALPNPPIFPISNETYLSTCSAFKHVEKYR